MARSTSLQIVWESLVSETNNHITKFQSFSLKLWSLGTRSSCQWNWNRFVVKFYEIKLSLSRRKALSAVFLMLAILGNAWTFGKQKYGKLSEEMKNLCHFSWWENWNSLGSTSTEKCISIITDTHLQHDHQKTKQRFTSWGLKNMCQL